MSIRGHCRGCRRLEGAPTRNPSPGEAILRTGEFMALPSSEKLTTGDLQLGREPAAGPAFAISGAKDAFSRLIPSRRSLSFSC